ncbi:MULTISPECIES: TetR/AcrR family transcriptional regulator [Streptosporangium]|uniref:AcrR family transcriptional regulator n=1 Tax=Streptosporangium brasiliense TaxID=47480 RepID=A0ABT9R0G7_9ACTN|nr:TetR/AcrR family transcriptional regulator [Streptosporangium brasiliense]MDP9862342.1 AcrR family transcriptional regulator [Streptosporangium brasiliense]
MTSADGGQRELILRVATRLFAAMGYDATSVSQIAEAAGLNVAAVTGHIGGKRELYLEVMERMYQVELASLEGVLKNTSVASPEEASALMHQLIDHYLDLCLAYPEMPALWMHRWLSDASDITELEWRYTQPLSGLIWDALEPAVAAGYIRRDVDIEYLIWSMIWCANSFSQSGVLDQRGNRRRMDDPRAMRRFRAHLHRMMHLTAYLQGDPPT